MMTPNDNHDVSDVAPSSCLLDNKTERGNLLTVLSFQLFLILYDNWRCFLATLVALTRERTRVQNGISTFSMETVSC